MAIEDNPPAWHEDPSRRHQYRWWDGEAWTDRVSTGGFEAIDPVHLDGARETFSVQEHELLEMAIVAVGRYVAEGDGTVTSREREQFNAILQMGTTHEQLPSAFCRAVFAGVARDPAGVGQRLAADPRGPLGVLGDAGALLSRLPDHDRELLGTSLALMGAFVMSAGRKGASDASKQLTGQALTTALQAMGFDPDDMRDLHQRN